MPEPRVWTITLYGWEPTLTLSGALELFDPIIAEWNLEVRQTELRLPDWKRERRPPLPKIRQLAVEQPNARFDFLSLYPSAKLYRELGYSRFALSIGQRRQNDLVVDFDESTVGSDGEANLETQLVELCRRLGPRYGYMCLLDALPLSPNFYAAGIGHDQLDEVTQRRIHDFGNDYHFAQDYLSRKLRDLYQWNVLSDTHLEASVGEVPLKAWIEQGNRGTLSNVAENVWLWKVGSTEFREVRSKLLMNGLLVVSI